MRPSATLLCLSLLMMGCSTIPEISVTPQAFPITGFEPEIKDYRDGDPSDPNSPMRKDPHYRLVESAAASAFEPSLAEIDRFLATLSTN